MAISKRRGFVFALLLLALVIAGGVGYYAWSKLQAERELEELAAALDRDDPGWRLEDLERQRTALPAEENSGPLILKLKSEIPRNWWNEVAEENWRDLSPGAPLPAEQAVLLQARMEPIKPLLGKLRSLKDRPRGHFPIAWSKDCISTVMPHMDAIRPIADVALADVYWQVYQGDLDGALVSCRAMVSIARSVEAEPLLISQLVHTACLGQALHGTQHTLAAGDVSAERLTELQNALAETGRHDQFVLAMRGERAGMHQLYTNLENGSVSLPQLMAVIGMRAGTTVTPVDHIENVYLGASIQRSHVWIVKHLTTGIEAARLPAGEQQVQLKALEAQIFTAPAMAKLLTPAWMRCHEAFQRSQAQLRCAQVGLAIERYRVKQGKWPADLAVLVPDYLKELPEDPCTSTALKYRRTGDGVVVYSVGPDCTRQGDYQDQPHDSRIMGPAHLGAFFEFRLWDTEKRGLAK
jgi:hypothetical protein